MSLSGLIRADDDLFNVSSGQATYCLLTEVNPFWSGATPRRFAALGTRTKTRVARRDGMGRQLALHTETHSTLISYGNAPRTGTPPKRGFASGYAATSGDLKAIKATFLPELTLSLFNESGS